MSIVKKLAAVLVSALAAGIVSAQFATAPPVLSKTQIQKVAAVSPVLFQHIAESANPAGIGVAGHAFVLHTEPLPANTVAVMAVTAPHGTAVSISDTVFGTWSKAVCTADAGTGNYLTAVFVQYLGATGGADTITVGVGSTSILPVSYDLTFWGNINPIAPVSGSLCTANITPATGGNISPGSFTPANNDRQGGNVIWNYNGIAFAASFNPTGWTPGSGFTLLNGDILWTANNGYPTSSQYEVQTTQASVTPQINGGGEGPTTNDYNSVSVALAVANTWAVKPTTIHVNSITHESFQGFSSPGTMKAVWPTTGNLRVIAFPWTGGCPDLGAGCLTATAVSFSDSCATTLIGGSAGSGGASIAYAQNCSPCATCTVSIVFAGTETIGQGSFRMYDVSNALASSYQNSTSGLTASCTTTTVNNSPTFTPTGATSGLTISTFGNELGFVSGFASGVPSGSVFDLTVYTGETSADMMDNADASNHYYHTSLSAQNWNYTLSTSPTECYFAAAAFN